jgi:hypothetical protein
MKFTLLNPLPQSFEGGDLQKGKIRLLASIGDRINVTRGFILRFGIKLGIILAMILLFIVFVLFGQFSLYDPTASSNRLAVPAYRVVFMYLLLGWLFGVCVWIWTKYRCNLTHANILYSDLLI